MTASIGPTPSALRQLARRSYRAIITGRMGAPDAQRMVAYLEGEGDQEAASWVRLAMASHHGVLRSHGFVDVAMRWFGGVR